MAYTVILLQLQDKPILSFILCHASVSTIPDCLRYNSELEAGSALDQGRCGIRGQFSLHGFYLNETEKRIWVSFFSNAAGQQL